MANVSVAKILHRILAGETVTVELTSLDAMKRFRNNLKSQKCREQQKLEALTIPIEGNLKFKTNPANPLQLTVSLAPLNLYKIYEIKETETPNDTTNP